jgi:hypothetical protein
MIWLTWRQFRIQAYIAAAALVAVVIVMAVNGHDLARLYADSGATSCTSNDCSAITTFLDRARQGLPGALSTLGLAVMYLVPALLGAFWGAPLVAREFDAGTYRLIWNQSVTRQRWLATKLAGIGLISVATVAALSLAVTWSAHRIDSAAMNRINPMQFGARGIVPVAYTAFAFALCVTAGVVIRRVLPAVGATLAIYTGVVWAWSTLVRAHLLPPKHSAVALDVDKIHGIGLSSTGKMFIGADVNLPGAWILDNSTTNPDGTTFVGPANLQYCGHDASPKSCIDWIASLNLKQSITYQPGSRFWALQWTESGVFLAVAALLLIVTFWLVRRRAA